MLGWLQEDPDTSAMVLLIRLQSVHRDRFNRAHLRTLQRRVQQRRRIMASELVHADSPATPPVHDSMPELVSIGNNAKG